MGVGGYYVGMSKQMLHDGVFLVSSELLAPTIHQILRLAKESNTIYGIVFHSLSHRIYFELEYE